MSAQRIIPLFKVHVDKSVALQKIGRVFDSGFVSEGQEVRELENELRRLFKCENLSLVDSCTSAITLALRLIGVGLGDDVVTTPMTCVATNMPILLAGAKPVWADIDPEIGMLTRETVACALTKNTRAVVFVDWAGSTVGLSEVHDLCQRQGIPLIQDAAHAFLAIHHGQPSHVFADYTCFFAKTKIFTSDGKKSICDIKIGDRVLTSTGEYKPVLQILNRMYDGEWTTIHAGQALLSATSNHPIKVHRNGIDAWVPIGDVSVGDAVYVTTKLCTRCASNLIPFYAKICETCYLVSNRADTKAKKVSKARKKHNRPTSRLHHHFAHVLRSVKPYAGRYKYQIVEKFARVPVCKVQSWKLRGNRKRRVFNLTLDQADPTYVANGFLVHNCYSFQAIKHFTTGDGGALVCRGDLEHERTKKIRWFGIDRDASKDANGEWKGVRWGIDIDEPGGKFNMNNVAAAIGLSQLLRIEAIVDRHRKNASEYDRLIAEWSAVSSHAWFKPMRKESGCVSSNWVYTVLVDDSIDTVDLLKYLNDNGIRAGKVHEPNHFYSCFVDSLVDLPGVERFYDRQITLPCGWWMDARDVRFVMKAAVNFVAKRFSDRS